MARCEECLHFEVCEALEQGNGLMKVLPIHCGYYKNAADVAPKSESDMLHHLLKDAWKRIEELDNLCGELQKAKTEVAREIFEEIENLSVNTVDDWGNSVQIIGEIDYTELAKKYTENCTTCKHLVSCEPNPFGTCKEYEERHDE